MRIAAASAPSIGRQPALIRVGGIREFMSAAMAPMDRILHTDGARIAYQVSGSKSPPVAYAHGVLLSRAVVRRMGVFDVDVIADGRWLLLYDQRGRGRSTGLPQPAYHTFEQAGVDLLDLLIAAGFEEPVDVAGSSLGAAAALYAVLVAPRRFRRLVLLIPPAAWEGGTNRSGGGTWTPPTRSTTSERRSGVADGRKRRRCRSSPTTHPVGSLPTSATTSPRRRYAASRVRICPLRRRWRRSMRPR